MRIQMLGTGGFYPNDGRHTACYALPDAALALDAGTAAYRLPRVIPGDELDLFLTHSHLDHIFGLTCLLIPVLNRQFRRITVHATERTIDAVCNHLFHEAVFPVNPPFECRVIPPAGELLLRNEYRIRWQPLPSHPGGSTAYRVDRLKSDLSSGESRSISSMAYITDTTVDAGYREFIRGVDLLIHECYFPDGREEFAELTGHSVAGDVARLARDAGVGRLVAVHVDPQAESEDPIGLGGMRNIFPRTEIGFDLMEMVVP